MPTINPADTWDQVVSQSIKQLSTKTPVVVPLKKLEVTAKAQQRHCLTRSREVGQIDLEIRKTIRAAAAGELKWPLSILGKPGTGKTCAGLCVADHVADSEWWTWDDLWRFVGDVNFGRAVTRHERIDFQGLRQAWTTEWTPKKFWDYFHGLPLAVIDDIGLRASANDTQYEAIKMALDRRENLPLIVTSNLDIPGLGMIFDLRVMDRLSCGTVISLQGESRR